LSPELAISAGITGPMLRACGVNYDIRKIDGYGIYPRFKFRIPLGDHGDTYDRLMMRALEMRESIEILKQALPQIPPGPIVNPKGEFARVSTADRRSVWSNRSAKRRARILFDQRWRAKSVPLSGAAAEFHQSDDPRRHVSGSHRRRCDGYPWQRRHR